jgi:hypothetical protein
LIVTAYEDSGPISVAISGDRVASRALVLLLGSSIYKARFLPGSSLNEPEALKGVQLLLLVPVPELCSERWKASVLAPLKDTLKGGELQVLELVMPSSGRQPTEEQDDSWHTVPWPCRIEELERRIEAILEGDPQ